MKWELGWGTAASLDDWWSMFAKGMGAGVVVTGVAKVFWEEFASSLVFPSDSSPQQVGILYCI